MLLAIDLLMLHMHIKVVVRMLISKKITILKDWVHEDLKPDLTILFDLPIDVSLSRLKSNGNLDKFEKEEAGFS